MVHDLAGYESVLGEFFAYCHRNAASGWVRDKRVRDTGPFVAASQPGGTWSRRAIRHSPAGGDLVHPEDDRVARRPTGRHESAPPAELAPIPDGAVMVKEMFPAPAARCDRFPAAST